MDLGGVSPPPNYGHLWGPSDPLPDTYTDCLWLTADGGGAVYVVDGGGAVVGEGKQGA